MGHPKPPATGPLDLWNAPEYRPAAPMPSLSSARIVNDLGAVPYPESVKAPNLDLNIAVMPGKFRYDREFLMQFMDACKGKPDSLAPVGILGLEPGQAGANYSANTRAGNRRVGSMGLGLGPSLTKGGGFAMGQFQSPAQGVDSQSRFDTSNNTRGPMPFAGPAGNRLTPMTRSASQGGGGGRPREAKRTRAQRGNNRGKNGTSGSGLQTLSQDLAGMNLEPFTPIEVDEDRWFVETSPHTLQKGPGNQLVGRKVTALLNKLTVDKFDSISDQIIAYANRSEQEKDGSTLMQVIYLAFDHAKEDIRFGDIYARLFRKMMEQVSPNIRDHSIRGSDGQPISGGMLFRKYLLNRCQDDFERGWGVKGAALAAAQSKSKADNDKAAQAASAAVLYSDEYFAAAKAKRQGLALVQFIGELFKQSMLTERIMHECIKKLLSNVVNPEEEEIESLCKLLTAVGQTLDNPSGRNLMDIYFERMNEMAKGGNLKPRWQFMVLDVIELRSRHWQARESAMTQSSPQRQDRGNHKVQHDAQQKPKMLQSAPEPEEPMQPSAAPLRSGALFIFPDVGLDEAGVATRLSPTDGTLLVARAPVPPHAPSSALQFGPTSVFSKKEPKREAIMGRASGASMFAALGGGGDVPGRMSMGRMPSDLKSISGLAFGGAPIGERKKLSSVPPTAPLGNKEQNKEVAASEVLSEADAKKKVEEDVQEYLGVENVQEAIMALEALPTEHRHLFVDKLVSSALDGGNMVVVLAEKLFAEAHKRSVISPQSFENGLLPTVEFADDISIDVPKTYEWLARFIFVAGFDKPKAEELAGKIAVEGTPMVHPRDQLVKAYEKASA